MKKIQRALISVYHKDGLETILEKLHGSDVELYSTGGTYDFILSCGLPAKSIEFLTGYPSILDGRVKTLHPKVFGGILARQNISTDQQQLADYDIPPFDLVIVDLYPFEQTLKETGDEGEIIEKIDIGGISLIRAAAKNFADVLVVAGRHMYAPLLNLIEENGMASSPEQRKYFAAEAFNVSSHYDTAIFHYFNQWVNIPAFKESITSYSPLRYGENPHQAGFFFGNLEEAFEQLHGKELSYNNLGDIDAAMALIDEFQDPTFAIIKHTNACGLASRPTLIQAWNDALAGDPVSAFGGVLICNATLDAGTASAIDTLFFEVILAPAYSEEGLALLKSKKNRIILRRKSYNSRSVSYRTAINGVLWQQADRVTSPADGLTVVTQHTPDSREIEDMFWANKVVKHSKSNAIVLAKNRQLLGSGTGQTSRVDAVRHAIEKAGQFGFGLGGAVMASDAFFPFSDSIGLAHSAGITAVIQPGGSVRDQESIDYCNAHGIAMAFTGIRHFKH